MKSSSAWAALLGAVSALPGCLKVSWTAPGESGGSAEAASRPALCESSRADWAAGAPVAQKVEASLCSDRMRPGDAFRSAEREDRLGPAMAIVACHLAEANPCSSPLDQAIRYDLANQITRDQVEAELAKGAVASPLASAFADAYDSARTALLAAPPQSEMATLYRGYTEARDAFWGAHQALAAEAEAALDALESGQGELERAIGARDDLVRACMRDSRFSSDYCWHATVARPLTQAIRIAAEAQGRPDVAYLEHQLLSSSGDLTKPATIVFRLLQSSDAGRHPWVASDPEAPPRYGPEASALFEKVVVSSAEVERIQKGKDHATIVFKTRVSAHHASGPCEDVLVVKKGRLVAGHRCAPGSSSYETHRTAPVQVPLEDVEHLEPGNRAFVVQAKSGAIGRLSFANPRATLKAHETQHDDPPHVIRFTKVRAAEPGLP